MYELKSGCNYFCCESNASSQKTITKIKKVYLIKRHCRKQEEDRKKANESISISTKIT